MSAKLKSKGRGGLQKYDNWWKDMSVCFHSKHFGEQLTSRNPSKYISISYKKLIFTKQPQYVQIVMNQTTKCFWSCMTLMSVSNDPLV